MLHYSCDQCGKDLSAGGADRFVLKMEGRAAGRPAELTDDDLDTDHIEEMALLLEEMEENGTEPDLPPVCTKLRFDLCSACLRKFLLAPLGREAAKFDFSPN
jgi:hypothetical protein